jgi:pyruvate formate lyase activating enzyme
MLRVHSLETFGTHEGPGIRLVVFLQGCHFRCLYCHNPDTWALDGGKEYTIDDILKKAIDEKPYFGNKGGITVSGGEPLIQREEVLKLFKQAHENNINTALDTNGSILDEKTKHLLEETDLVLLDIKQIDDAAHKKLTGVSNYVPLQFADYLESIRKKFWVRYVLVPGYTSQKRFITNLGKRLSQYKSLERVEILPYHTYGAYKYKELGLDYALSKVKPPDADTIGEAQSILSQFVKTVKVR